MAIEVSLSLSLSLSLSCSNLMHSHSHSHSHSTCLKKCAPNQELKLKKQPPPSSSSSSSSSVVGLFRIAAVSKQQQHYSKVNKKKKKKKKNNNNEEEDLCRLLWTEAAVKGIHRKAISTSTTKFTNLSPKPLLEALHQAIQKNTCQTALQIFGLLRKQHWYKPTSQTYTQLFIMLAKSRKPHYATFLFHILLSDGLHPTLHLFTAFLNAYAISALFHQAFSILHHMNSLFHSKPDAHTYSVLLNACIKHSRFDLVNPILSDMSSLGIQCTTVTYNTIIHGYGKAKLFTIMENLLSHMTQTPNTLPDVFTFNSFLTAHGSCGHIQSMEKWYQEFQQMGITPDVRTFNILITSYGKAGMHHKMESVLQYMEKRFFSPTVVTFNTIIDIYGRAGNVDKMDTFFLKMKHQGIKPNTFTFCSTVNAYSKARKLYKVDSIIRQIHNSDVLLDTPFFNCVINAYGRAGNIDKMRGMLQEMTERNCEPDHITFATLLQAYNANGMTDAAEELKSNMLTTKSYSGSKRLRCK